MEHKWAPIALATLLLAMGFVALFIFDDENAARIFGLFSAAVIIGTVLGSRLLD
jgi:hypothetical protein